MDDRMQVRDMLRASEYRTDRQVQNKFEKCCRESSDLAWDHSGHQQQCKISENMTGVCHHQASCWGDTGTVSVVM